MAGILLFQSCGNDNDEPDPNKPETIDPGKPTADPTGTVVLRMRNDNETLLGEMIVSPDNNFHCKRGMIASIGSVAGLGNITDIPLTGWSTDVAVTPGNGYVYYDGNRYYRIYAIQWFYSAQTTGAILGIELKYQTPFAGLDQELVPENTALSFTDEGGTSEVRFKNTAVIPFTIETEDCNWCRVEKWTSSDKTQNFLYDGLRVMVYPSQQMEESRTKVTIKTLSGKTSELEIVRAGQSPTVYFPNGETEYTMQVEARDGEYSIPVTTNIEDGDFKSVSDADWLVIESDAKAPLARNMHEKIIKFKVSSNTTSAKRDAKLTLSSTKGEKVSVLTIEQEAGKLNPVYSEDVEISAAGGNSSISLFTNIPGEFSIKSSQTWCKPVNEKVEVTYSGNFQIGLNAEPNTGDKPRSATVTITSADGKLSTKVNVTQKSPSFDNVPSAVYFNSERGSQAIQLPVKDMKVTSSEDWCQTLVEGNQLRIIVEKTNVNRKAIVSLTGTSVKITVDQSKYKVGDTYDEKGVKGIVFKMDGERRLVRSEQLGKAAYTTSEFYTIGTNDTEDGQINMNKVRSLKSWQEYYPAFALCDALNKDGITDWYLPASSELEKGGIEAWSSTESGDSYAYYCKNGSKLYTSYKHELHPVYAVHRFVD